MLYIEISPGVLLDSNNKVHYKLSRCPCCGGEEMVSHVKYTEMCIECGNQYNIYAVRRSQRARNKIKNSAAVAHLQIIEDFLSKREAGLVVPSSLDEEAAATLAIVANTQALELARAKLNPRREQGIPVDTLCAYCNGRAVAVAIGRSASQPKLYLCESCSATYARYKHLTKHVGTLTIDECNELADIMRHYIYINSTGTRVPYFSKYVRALQARAVSLGEGKYVLYGYHTPMAKCNIKTRV